MKAKLTKKNNKEQKDHCGELENLDDIDSDADELWREVVNAEFVGEGEEQPDGRT